MAKVKVSEKDFARYVRVQMGGRTNMFDTRMVSLLSGLKRETILAVMDTYDELSTKFPKVLEKY